jgi:hypothetical protein
MYLIFSVLGHKCVAILLKTSLELFVQSDKFCVSSAYSHNKKYVLIHILVCLKEQKTSIFLWILF